MVVMFLIYSGYGIMESFCRKKEDYIKSFLRKRVLKTLVHFDIAVALFFLLAVILGHKYTTEEYLLSWIGWLNIGNSNWFIFDILALYLLAYLTLLVGLHYELNERTLTWINFGLTCGLMVVLLKSKSSEEWWYDTILAFPTGMLWSIYRKRLEPALKDWRQYWLSFGVVTLLFVCTYYMGHHFKVAFFFVASALFGIWVILLTMKLKIGNRILHWLGKNAFSIYILQRLSMIVATEYGINQQPLLFMLIVIPSSLLIAFGFTSFTRQVDKKLFS